MIKIEREARILNQIKHDGIIKFVNLIKEEKRGIYIILTEYFHSITLEAFIKLKNPSKIEDPIIICYKIYEAIKYLHDNDIAHRDLTLCNILINPIDLSIKLIDFGIARNVDVMEIYSPEGNIKYRPPLDESFQNLYHVDIWNTSLVFLSIILETNITSKSACILIQNKEKEIDVKPNFKRRILETLEKIYQKSFKHWESKELLKYLF